MFFIFLEKKSRRKQLSYKLFIISLVLIIFISWPKAKIHGQIQAIEELNVLELNQQIQSKKVKMEEIKKQKEFYRNKIREAQKQAISLHNQINILDSSINETTLDIEAKLLEIEALELESELLATKITQELKRIDETKIKMAEILKNINQLEKSKGRLINFLNHKSFSDLFDELYRGEILVAKLYDQLQTIKQIKESLKANQELIETKKEETAAKKQQLDELKITLEEEKNLKVRLLNQTKSSEKGFQQLLEELRKEEAEIDSEIVTLEKVVRQKLQALDGLTKDGKLSWPINPSQGITAYFHDPDYPFRYLFEHSGIDIRAPQGTPVQAAAGGYVAKVFNGGMSNKPSYIMIVHADGLATVYMHLSSINVVQDTYVSRGQIIGASGGIPGTPGAGRWTTGPHLHFEVRLNGIPVDPLNYLP
jgi:murein DD-endopeptidase MepM/ murein hydrolase activator NlpD